MQKLRDRPIREKITFVIMLISGVVLLLAFAALFCFQAYTLKRHSAHELAVVGEITAHNCAPAVMFKDEGAAGSNPGWIEDNATNRERASRAQGPAAAGLFWSAYAMSSKSKRLG